MSIYTRSFFPAPASASSFAEQLPAGTAQTRAAFTWQRVCYQPPVSERRCSSPRRAVEGGAYVRRAVCAAPIYFERPAVIKHPSDRTTDYSDAEHCLAVSHRQTELRSRHRLVVPVMRLNKGIGFGERHRTQPEWPNHALQPVLESVEFA